MNKFLNRTFETYNYWKGTFESLTDDQVKTRKIIIMVLMVLDMFGVYYYLQWKKIGIALLFVLILILIPLIIKEKDSNKEKTESNSKPKVNSGGFENLLGNSKDYNKRMEKAMGFNPLGFKNPTSSQDWVSLNPLSGF